MPSSTNQSEKRVGSSSQSSLPVPFAQKLQPQQQQQQRSLEPLVAQRNPTTTGSATLAAPQPSKPAPPSPTTQQHQTFVSPRTLDSHIQAVATAAAAAATSSSSHTSKPLCPQLVYTMPAVVPRRIIGLESRKANMPAKSSALSGQAYSAHVISPALSFPSSLTSLPGKGENTNTDRTSAGATGPRHNSDTEVLYVFPDGASGGDGGSGHAGVGMQMPVSHPGHRALPLPLIATIPPENMSLSSIPSVSFSERTSEDTEEEEEEGRGEVEGECRRVSGGSSRPISGVTTTKPPSGDASCDGVAGGRADNPNPNTPNVLASLPKALSFKDRQRASMLATADHGASLSNSAAERSGRRLYQRRSSKSFSYVGTTTTTSTSGRATSFSSSSAPSGPFGYVSESLQRMRDIRGGSAVHHQVTPSSGASTSAYTAVLSSSNNNTTITTTTVTTDRQSSSHAEQVEQKTLAAQATSNTARMPSPPQEPFQRGSSFDCEARRGFSFGGTIANVSGDVSAATDRDLSTPLSTLSPTVAFAVNTSSEKRGDGKETEEASTEIEEEGMKKPGESPTSQVISPCLPVPPTFPPQPKGERSSQPVHRSGLSHRPLPPTLSALEKKEHEGKEGGGGVIASGSNVTTATTVTSPDSRSAVYSSTEEKASSGRSRSHRTSSWTTTFLAAEAAEPQHKKTRAWSSPQEQNPITAPAATASSPRTIAPDEHEREIGSLTRTSAGQNECGKSSSMHSPPDQPQQKQRGNDVRDTERGSGVFNSDLSSPVETALAARTVESNSPSTAMKPHYFGRDSVLAVPQLAQRSDPLKPPLRFSSGKNANEGDKFSSNPTGASELTLDDTGTARSTFQSPSCSTATTAVRVGPSPTRRGVRLPPGSMVPVSSPSKMRRTATEGDLGDLASFGHSHTISSTLRKDRGKMLRRASSSLALSNTMPHAGAKPLNAEYCLPPPTVIPSNTALAQQQQTDTDGSAAADPPHYRRQVLCTRDLSVSELAVVANTSDNSQHYSSDAIINAFTRRIEDMNDTSLTDEDTKLSGLVSPAVTASLSKRQQRQQRCENVHQKQDSLDTSGGGFANQFFTPPPLGTEAGAGGGGGGLHRPQQQFLHGRPCDGPLCDSVNTQSQLLCTTADPLNSTSMLSAAATKENRRTSTFSSLQFSMQQRRGRKQASKRNTKHHQKHQQQHSRHLSSPSPADTTASSPLTCNSPIPDDVDTLREEKGDSASDQAAVAELLLFDNFAAEGSLGGTIGMWETVEHVFMPKYEVMENGETAHETMVRTLCTGLSGASDGGSGSSSSMNVKSPCITVPVATVPATQRESNNANKAAVSAASPPSYSSPVTALPQSMGHSASASFHFPLGTAKHTRSRKPDDATAYTFGVVAPDYNVEPEDNDKHGGNNTDANRNCDGDATDDSLNYGNTESKDVGTTTHTNHEAAVVADCKIAARLTFDGDKGVMLLALRDEVEKYVSANRQHDGEDGRGNRDGEKGREEEEDDGACDCEEAFIGKDSRGVDYSKYHAHTLYSHCDCCHRQPAAFLCLHCFKAVCPSHVTRHHQSNQNACSLFLNVLDIMTSFDRIFWCEKCGRFTWKYTEIYDPLVDQIAYTRGTYLDKAVRDIHCIGFEVKLRETNGDTAAVRSMIQAQQTLNTAGLLEASHISGAGSGAPYNFSLSNAAVNPDYSMTGIAAMPSPVASPMSPSHMMLSADNLVFPPPALTGGLATLHVPASNGASSPMHCMLERDSQSLSGGGNNIVAVGEAVTRLVALGASVQGWRATQEDAEVAFLVDLPSLGPDAKPAKQAAAAARKRGSPSEGKSLGAMVGAKSTETEEDYPTTTGGDGGRESRGENPPEAGEKPDTIPMAVFCVFDGHGGDAVAKLAASRIEKHLRDAIQRTRPDDIRARALLFHINTESSPRLGSLSYGVGAASSTLPAAFAGLGSGGATSLPLSLPSTSRCNVPLSPIMGGATAGGTLSPARNLGCIAVSPGRRSQQMSPRDRLLLPAGGGSPFSQSILAYEDEAGGVVLPVTENTLRQYLAASSPKHSNGRPGSPGHRSQKTESRSGTRDHLLRAWNDDEEGQQQVSLLPPEVTTSGPVGSVLPVRASNQLQRRYSNSGTAASSTGGVLPSASAVVSVSEMEMLRSYFASIMEDALLTLDDYIHKTPEGERGDYNCVGCTACLVGITTNFILCANVGDSGAAFYTSTSIDSISTKHRVSDPKEQSRIKAAGYSVSNDRIEGLLAVPRALGDFDFKQSGGRGPKEQAVIAAPDVTIRPVPSDEEKWGVIVACDGVWDTATQHQVHYAVTNTPYDLDVASSATEAVLRAKELLRNRRRGPPALMRSEEEENEEGEELSRTPFLPREPHSPSPTLPAEQTKSGDKDKNKTTYNVTSRALMLGDSLTDTMGPDVLHTSVDSHLLTAAAGVFAQCVAPSDNNEGIGLDNCSLIIIEKRE